MIKKITFYISLYLLSSSKYYESYRTEYDDLKKINKS